ncbi:hypothetical protein IGI96_003643 [Enterococcus sp. DIV0421]|uniref:ABC transporter ATP-binding protein/permease n=1 Tax=Enterococcus sp. DIV0421 TaxID=2774688 RepID=UPI003F25A7D6
MLDKYLYNFIGTSRKLIITVVFLMMIRVLMLGLIAVAFAAFVLGEEKAFLSLSVIGSFVIGFKVRALAIKGITKFQAKIISQVKSNIRKVMLEKSLSIGAAYKNNFSTSDLINMGVDTIEQLENYYGRFVTEYYGVYGTSFVTFCILFFLNWRVALLFLMLFPIIPLFLKFLLEMVTTKQTKYWGKYQDVSQLFLDSLQGIKTLKIFCADKKRQKEIERLSEDFRKETMSILAMQLNSITIIEWIAYGSTIFVICFAGKEYISGNLNEFGLIVTLIIMLEGFKPMITLTSTFHVAMTGVAAGKKIIDLLQIPDTKSEKVCSNFLDILVIKDLSFNYKNQKKVLDEINLEINLEKGFIAFVGESGCGKTTLMNLILGVTNNYTGQIMFVNKDKSCLKNKRLETVITRIGHNSHFFEGTVRDNLLVASPYVSDEYIVDLLKKVRLFDELKFRGGLDCLLTSGGSNLSGGQRQRLALVRAIIKDSPMYIFDEATSNIDAESEEIIFNIIKELSKSRAVFVISHRLKNIVEADMIVHLNSGKILGKGTHSELMKIDDIYKKMVDLQFKIEAFSRGIL